MASGNCSISPSCAGVNQTDDPPRLYTSWTMPLTRDLVQINGGRGIGVDVLRQIGMNFCHGHGVGHHHALLFPVAWDAQTNDPPLLYTAWVMLYVWFGPN